MRDAVFSERCDSAGASALIPAPQLISFKSLRPTPWNSHPTMNFSEVVILIPSHSLEGLPSELGEKPAASLLNVFAVAWHPVLLLETQCLPSGCGQTPSRLSRLGGCSWSRLRVTKRLTAEWAQAAQAEEPTSFAASTNAPR